MLEKVNEGLTPKGYWYESNEFSGSEHGGTHLDAPAHFARGKWHIEEIPLDRLIAPGIVVDVRKRALDNPDYLIRKQDFLDWEKQHGTIPEKATVLVLTGFESFWPDKKRYLGTDSPVTSATSTFQDSAPRRHGFWSTREMQGRSGWIRRAWMPGNRRILWRIRFLEKPTFPVTKTSAIWPPCPLRDCG